MNIRLSNCITIIEYAIQHNISISAACVKSSKGKNYVSNFIDVIEKRKEQGQINQPEYDAFYEVYNRYSNKLDSDLSDTVVFQQYKLEELRPLNNLDIKPITAQEQADIDYNAELDESYDERSLGESVRDDIGKIKFYSYKILIKNQQPLEGTFSRDEMDKVYRLYSNIEGAGLNLRAVSREFSNLSYRDFKRIIRAFNITKQSIPIAPHILEENSEEVITEYVLRNKENNVLKKLETDKGKFIEKNLIDAQKKLIEIQSVDDYIQSVVEKYIEKKDDIVESKILQPSILNNLKHTGKPTIVFFGDIHLGKKFEHPIFGRGYNKDIAAERLIQLANEVIKDYKSRESSEIFLICGGDLVESIASDGIHQGHHFEMDLFQEDQIFAAVDALKNMIKLIDTNVDCKINISIIGGNHCRIGEGRDDDKNRTAAKIIAHILKRELESKKIVFNIPKNNLIRLVVGKLCIFMHHGDSSLSKKNTAELIALYGESGCFHLIVQAHWHRIKVEEGNNYLNFVLPSMCSSDKFIIETLGSSSTPGFIIGNEPDVNGGYGFDYRKLTSY